MSETNITDNRNNLIKICSISLTVIFFILSFLTNFNNIVVFVLALLSLGLVILLSYKKIKEVSFYVLGIVFIPFLSYGVICAISNFSTDLYTISTRIFLVVNILLFLVAGYFSRLIEGFDFKWIFKGIFLSLSIICLINLIATLVSYGPFYGFRIPYYYSYYDGSEARVTVSGCAYALCGFSIKQVPIEYYLVYPFLLLSSIFMYLLGNRKDKFNIISTCCFVLVALISLIFVISKISLIFIVLYLLFIGVISILLIFKKIYGKAFKYCLIILTFLGAIFFIVFFINSQYNLTGFRNFIASNRLLNYVFNTNRYSEGARVILNGIFSTNKIIGFPVYFDYDYGLASYPSNNILINQFMYSGVFGFIFFIILIGLFVYTFKQVKKLDIEDKVYKYLPLLFIISYFAATFISDQSSFDLYNPKLISATYLSPFFLMSVFIFGHYYSLANSGGKKDEE